MFSVKVQNQSKTENTKMIELATVTITGLDLYAFWGISQFEEKYQTKFSGAGGDFMLSIAADCFEDILDIPDNVPIKDNVVTPFKGKVRIYNACKSHVDFFRWAAKAHGCKVSEAYTLFARWVAEGWYKDNLRDWMEVNGLSSDEDVIERLAELAETHKAFAAMKRNPAIHEDEDECN